MKKRILSLALAASMATSMLPTVSLAAGTTSFGDTKGHWAEASIDRWSEYKIVEGYEGNFNPDADLTRGQMAKIIANTMGLTEEAKNPFADLDTSAWYAPYILRCYEAGIMQGDGTNANPENTITRAETMTLLGRALGITPVDNADLSTYGDAGDVADWAKGYVAAMVEAGIINGTSDGLLAPNLAINRATIMTILDRSITQYINAPGTYELAADGLILVACGGVTLTGKSAADLIVTPGASGAKVTFKKAEITGNITVQGDNVKVISNNSKLPTINATGSGVTVSKPSSGGGSSSGGTTPTPDDNIITGETYTLAKDTGLLTVTAAATLDGNDFTENVKNIVIADTVGEGTVELKNFNVENLTVNGGGDESIILKNFVTKIVEMAKKTGEKTPRLFLKDGAKIETKVVIPEGTKGAIIEAEANVDAIPQVEAKADVTVKGDNTQIGTVYATGTDTVTITVEGKATISTVEAKGNNTYITGDDTATVGTVVAEKPVKVESGVVNTVKVTAAVTVEVKGTASITVTVNTIAKVEVKTEENNNVFFEKGEDVKKEDVNVSVSEGDKEPEEVEHFCDFSGEPTIEEATCTKNGTKTWTCSDSTCTKTKTETIVALGHEMGEWSVTTAATCTTAGVETRTCSRNGCDYSETRAIAATGHKWATEWSKDETYHWHICQNDSSHIDEKVKHTYDTDGKCVCGAEKPTEGGDDTTPTEPSFSISFNGLKVSATYMDTSANVTVSKIEFKTADGATVVISQSDSYFASSLDLARTYITAEVTYKVGSDTTEYKVTMDYTVEVQQSAADFTYSNAQDTDDSFKYADVYASTNDTNVSGCVAYIVSADTADNYPVKLQLTASDKITGYYLVDSESIASFGGVTGKTIGMKKDDLTSSTAKLYSVKVETDSTNKKTTIQMSRPVYFGKSSSTTNP